MCVIEVQFLNISKQFVIWEGIKPTKPFYNRDIQTKMLKLDMGKMRDITYTPDFTFEYKNHLIIIEAKGFENAMVSISNGNADVIVDSKNLTDKEIAQIEDIVKRKTGIESANIVITPVDVTK